MHGLIRAPAILLAAGLLLASTAAIADGFRVRRVETRVVEDVYYLDAHVDLELSAAALEALEHGVPISIVFDEPSLTLRSLTPLAHVLRKNIPWHSTVR